MTFASHLSRQDLPVEFSAEGQKTRSRVQFSELKILPLFQVWVTFLGWHSCCPFRAHTHTHKHAHTLFLFYTYTLGLTNTNTHSLAQTLAHLHSNTHTLSHSFFLSLTNTHSTHLQLKMPTNTPSQSLVLSFPHSLLLSPSLTILGRLLLLLLLTLKEIECPREICCVFPLSSSLNLTLSPSLSFLICVFEHVHFVSFSWFKVSNFFFVLSDRGIFLFHNQLNVTVAAFCKNFLFLFFEFVTFYSSWLYLTFSARCIFSTYLWKNRQRTRKCDTGIDNDQRLEIKFYLLGFTF